MCEEYDYVEGWVEVKETIARCCRVETQTFTASGSWYKLKECKAQSLRNCCVCAWRNKRTWPCDIRRKCIVGLRMERLFVRTFTSRFKLSVSDVTNITWEVYVRPYFLRRCYLMNTVCETWLVIIYDDGFAFSDARYLTRSPSEVTSVRETTLLLPAYFWVAKSSCYVYLILCQVLIASVLGCLTFTQCRAAVCMFCLILRHHNEMKETCKSMRRNNNACNIFVRNIWRKETAFETCGYVEG